VLETGDILVGRYEVDSLLGRGGMSSVFSGWDRTLGREVAIKVLAAELAEDRVFVERFDREARAAASLSHRNVVAVFDSGVDGGARFIVMEHVSGETLAARMREGPMPVEQAVEIALGVLRALGAAHARGIVHRDVKPGNVMLSDNGQVKVLDFGIARALAATSLTRASTVIGTAGYLSPEQAEGAAVDARSDLYGLGCVLYEMLAGRPPFVADSVAALVHQHISRAPDPPSRSRPEVSPALDGAVLRCLAKDPGERYADADALCAALIGAPAHRPAAASERADTTTLLQRRRKRHWLLAPGGAALLGALLLLALDHGTAGRPGGATARASAAAPTRSASDPKRQAATAPRHSATTASTAAQASATQDPAAAAAALSAMSISDQRQGLIDQRAAGVISRRTAALLSAVAARDPNEAARALAQFGRRVDALAAKGDIATVAAAGALKSAAAGVANTLIAASPVNAQTAPASAEPDAEGEAPAPVGTGRGRGHRHDRAAGESPD
jgi:serine/threonine-protein kinase